MLQNNRGGIPHFLIVNNLAFEYVACLHFSEYHNQEIGAFLTDSLGCKSIYQFKSNGVITKQDVIELLKVTPTQAYAVIKKLQQEGKLELLYGGKYSKYKIVE